VKTIRLPVRWKAVAAVTLILSSAAARPARADFQLINNGGFEVGFAGWTRQDFLGSDGTFFLQTGSTSPINHDPVPAPPGGLTAAMTDAQAGVSHVTVAFLRLLAGDGASALRLLCTGGDGAVAVLQVRNLLFNAG